MELKITDLTKKFQDIAAVDGVSYTLTAGVYGLLGVNGAGKDHADADALYLAAAHQRIHHLGREGHL